MKDKYGTGFRFADGGVCYGLTNDLGEEFIAMYLFPGKKCKPEEFIGSEEEWKFGRLVERLQDIRLLSKEKWGYGANNDEVVTKLTIQSKANLIMWLTKLRDMLIKEK